MTKRMLKHNLTKRKKCQKKTKKKHNNKLTKKIKYGGDVVTEQKKKIEFRNNLNNYINLIAKNSSRNKIKEGITSLINLFKNNEMINTLIPISSSGKYITKGTYFKVQSTEDIIDYVSPIVYMLDNISGLELVLEKDIIRILDAYFENGGNFNNLSSRFKISPFKNELNKKRINNIKILLDKSNSFHIYEDGLDEETKTKLAELIPTEQQIMVSKEYNPEIETDNKLKLPSILPDNQTGYDRTIVPEFWKPLFKNENELLNIREKFMEFYAQDKYVDDNQKRIKICDILEIIIPGYFTRYTLDYRETAKTLININILNCFITLFYGIILQKLYETKQEYVFMFKGGRALQLSLVGIDNIGKYFSEDTDILIIPNPQNANNANEYNLLKMENLSEHIAYLIKWMIPEEINIIVSLPTNPKNTNKDITKLVYNDGKLFKSLSDIGFGEINQDIRKYFENLSYSPFNIESFGTIALFITPNLDDMLSEKLFYYAKYLKLKDMLEKHQPIMETKYLDLTKEDCNYLLFKFKRAILKLVEAIINRDYSDVVDFDRKNTSRLILRGFIGNFEDYTNEEKENTIISIFP